MWVSERQRLKRLNAPCLATMSTGVCEQTHSPRIHQIRYASTHGFTPLLELGQRMAGPGRACAREPMASTADNLLEVVNGLERQPLRNIVLLKHIEAFPEHV